MRFWQIPRLLSILPSRGEDLSEIFLYSKVLRTTLDGSKHPSYSMLRDRGNMDLGQRRNLANYWSPFVGEGGGEFWNNGRWDWVLRIARMGRSRRGGMFKRDIADVWFHEKFKHARTVHTNSTIHQDPAFCDDTCASAENQWCPRCTHPARDAVGLQWLMGNIMQRYNIST